MKTALGPNAAVPCRVTEMGPRPWQDLDKRYPRLTPQEHARQVVLSLPLVPGRGRDSWPEAARMAQGGLFLDHGRQSDGDYSFIFEADTFYGDWEMGAPPG